jgi:hypothetical protein
MRVQINNNQPFWFEYGDQVKPLEEVEEPLVVGADPSKTNAAFVIGTLSGKIHMVIQMSGNDKNFYQRAEDTTHFCRKMVDYLTKLFVGSEIIGFGQEKTITPEMMKGRSKTFNHVTNTVLNEVRSSLRKWSLDVTGKLSEEIPTSRWKSTVLPPAYYSMKKGSFPYWCSVNPVWGNYNDDVTDALSIYYYMCSKLATKAICECTKVESPKYEYEVKIVDKSRVPDKSFKIKLKGNLTIQEGIIFFINRYSSVGVLEVPLEDISLNMLWESSFELKPWSNPVIVVKRK